MQDHSTPRVDDTRASDSPEHASRMTRNGIRFWPEGERPREKFINHGAEALTDAELLAIILNSGTGARSALDIARSLLGTYGSLRSLARRPITELRGIHGIGLARAVSLQAAFEIGRRHAATPENPTDAIVSPEDVAHRFIPRLRDLRHERFMVLLLDNAGRIIRECIVSEGIVNASLVHPREVFRHAVTELASSVILLHNHPSGVREASREDHLITRQLVQAGRLIDIPVHDHIIVCGSSYISFAENGWLDEKGNT
ncbi:MAG: DNA repair protein RadC [Bacteroidota bacterium]|jgi:DNA repair protein RadC|nr:DNA repair protein RadC [Bacteroidota bacterium]